MKDFAALYPFNGVAESATTPSRQVFRDLSRTDDRPLAMRRNSDGRISILAKIEACPKLSIDDQPEIKVKKLINLSFSAS